MSELVLRRYRAFWLLLIAGCSNAPSANYGKVDLVEVSGKVTLDNQPLPNAVITFEDPTNGTFSFGQTDGNGYYTLRLDSVKTGVTVGKKTVRISTTRKLLGLNASEEVGEASTEGSKPNAPEPEKVLSKYNKQSELTADVSASQRSFNFELASK